MKIIYFASFFTTDSDFPLIRKFQEKGIDVIYCLMASRYGNKAGVVNLKNNLETGIYKAAKLEEFQIYKDYINLDRVYVLYNNSKHGKGLHSLLFHIKVFCFFKKQKADIIHFAWYQRFYGKMFYYLGIKKCLTVHDPFEHSGNGNSSVERDRKIAFANMDKLILLNASQLKKFAEYYNIDEDKIILNKMGYFDYLQYINQKHNDFIDRNILFFGYIREYKGLEFLCKAMKMVHSKFPNLKLIIAGGGKLYFDWKPYSNLDYIKLYNRFIDLPELAGFLDSCEFSVCPYTDATQSGVVQTAFSMNVPMIVTDVGALSEVVENGKNGIVVPPCNTIALADAIIDLLDDTQKLNSMRANIKNEWQKNMSWGPIADKYIKCYKSLLQ